MKLLLDLDGTLLDARPRLFALFSALEPRSVLTFEEYWRLKRRGQSNQEVLRDRCGASGAEIERFVERWMSLIESPSYLALDRPLPGTLAALRAMRGMGCELYVVTARQHRDVATEQIAASGLGEYILDSFVTERHSTKAELLRASGLPIASDDCLVGDTGADVQAARALGMRAVAVLSGFLDRETLSRYDPDVMEEDVSTFASTLLARR